MHASVFLRFDTDRSGNINARELHQAFTAFGYNLWVDHFGLVVIMEFTFNNTGLQTSAMFACVFSTGMIGIPSTLMTSFSAV
jgi:Ca2+-binding EF-hand superfamily protein